MSKGNSSVLTQFSQREAEAIAQFEQFRQWSTVMIQQMIREQESKLLASDLPVDADDSGGFWEEM